MFVVKKRTPNINPYFVVVIAEPHATALQLMVQCGKHDIESHAVVYTVTNHQAGASFAASSLKISPGA